MRVDVEVRGERVCGESASGEEQMWLLDRGVYPDVFFGEEPEEFPGEGEFFRELTLDDEGRVVFTDDGTLLYPYEEEDARSNARSNAWRR